MVFSTDLRTDAAPGGYSEPMFAYLERSSRVEAAKVRALVDDWFAQFPSSAQPELRERLRSPDDTQLVSAFFELYTFHFLALLGYEIDVHPPIAHTTRAPDFKASAQGTPPLYVEAATALHESQSERGASSRADFVYDQLNRLRSPDFWLGIHVRGAPKTPPRTTALRRRLSAWLQQLDWEELRRAYEGGNVSLMPSLEYTHDGWDLTFQALPKPPHLRGRPEVRPIATRSSAFWASNAKDAIRRTMSYKANAYGDLTPPYVVAINSYGIHTDSEDVIEALFGTAQVHIALNEDPPRPQITLAPDGAWRGPSGPRNARMSAILMTYNLSPWTVAARETILYVNPWADSPLTRPLSELTRTEIRDGKPVRVDGISVKSLLGLPSCWPED
jgi:hypothetical protein